jgi:hypothetical protein
MTKQLHAVNAQVTTRNGARVWVSLDITIDIKAIAAEMAQKAYWNKSKKSKEIAGAVVVDIVQEGEEFRNV